MKSTTIIFLAIVICSAIFIFQRIEHKNELERISIQEKGEEDQRKKQMEIEQKRLNQEKDVQEWNYASSQNTLDAFRKYKVNNPSGNFRQQADDAMQRIKDEQKVEELASSNGEYVIISVYHNGMEKNVKVLSWELIPLEGHVLPVYKVKVQMTWNGDIDRRNSYEARGDLYFSKSGGFIKWHATFLNDALKEYMNYWGWM